MAPIRPVRAAAPTVPVPAAPPASSLHSIGVISCCGYLFSGYGNDLSMRFIGAKAYLSWIFGSLMLICFLGSGTALRGLQSKIGKYWFGIVVCLLFSTAFSIGRGSSLDLMQGYIPKSLLVFFYICSCAVSIRSCRTLIMGNILCVTAVLVSVSMLGATDEGGRLVVGGSLFLGNSNDLALALVSGLGFCVFLIWQKSTMLRILGSVEFLMTIYFLLKTGSRGGFIALAVCVTLWMIFSNHRGRLVALAVPALVLVAALPSSTLSRLTQIAAPGDGISAAAAATDTYSQQALDSQNERTDIFHKSVNIAIHHPLLGTGPNTFMDALWDEDVANGTHTHAIGTHNTYTQIASEWGFPGLFLYLGIIFGSIGANYRIMKATRNIPGADGIFAMALCLFGSIIGFAMATIFHHDAYNPTLPVFSAITVSLYLAARGGDPRWIASEIASGKV